MTVRRAQLQTEEALGMDLAGYEQLVQPTPLPHDQELRFEWTPTSGVDG